MKTTDNLQSKLEKEKDLFKLMMRNWLGHWLINRKTKSFPFSFDLCSVEWKISYQKKKKIKFACHYNIIFNRNSLFVSNVCVYFFTCHTEHYNLYKCCLNWPHWWWWWWWWQWWLFYFILFFSMAKSKYFVFLAYSSSFLDTNIIFEIDIRNKKDGENKEKPRMENNHHALNWTIYTQYRMLMMVIIKLSSTGNILLLLLWKWFSFSSSEYREL